MDRAASRDMETEEFRRYGRETLEWVAEYFDDPRRYPVLARCAAGELRGLLPEQGPLRGEPMEAILADFRELIVPRLTHWNHPHFHGYFSISGSAPGVLGELLTAALDVNAMLWKSSPAATELEQVTVAWVLDWLGLPKWFGMIVDSASSAVAQAMVAARQWKEPESRAEGPSGRLVAYVSEHTHSSVEKAAIAAGIGQRNVRRIGTDEGFRMRPELLEAAILADQAAGLKPFFAAATVGTTSTTAVDPVDAIADLCQKYGLWLHVDGAYGGSFGLLPERAELLKGVERADSFVVNPHKMLMVPLDCSLFYTAHPEVLRAAYSLEAEYLKTDAGDAVDFMDYGLALGRRFRALKLWFVLRYFGRDGLAEILRGNLRMAAWLGERVEESARFELVTPATLGLVCFRLRAGDAATRALMQRINGTGRHFVSHTVLNGQFAIRVAIGNIRTEQRDVEELWTVLCDGASGLPSQGANA